MPPARMCGKSSTSRMDAESVSSMTSRSMPMPRPPAGGMPYSMGAEVVLVEPIASSSPASLAVHLRLEALALVDGIDELGEGVGVLAAEDDELEALGELRLARRCLRRAARSRAGYIGHEGRLARACARRASRRAR